MVNDGRTQVTDRVAQLPPFARPAVGKRTASPSSWVATGRARWRCGRSTRSLRGWACTRGRVASCRRSSAVGARARIRSNAAARDSAAKACTGACAARRGRIGLPLLPDAPDPCRRSNDGPARCAAPRRRVCSVSRYAEVFASPLARVSPVSPRPASGLGGASAPRTPPSAPRPADAGDGAATDSSCAVRRSALAPHQPTPASGQWWFSQASMQRHSNHFPR